MKIKDLIDALGTVACPPDKARSRINYWVGMGLLAPTGGKGNTSPREFSDDDRACAIILSRLTDFGMVSPEVLRPVVAALRQAGFEAMSADLQNGRALRLYVTILEYVNRKLRVVVQIDHAKTILDEPDAEEVFSFNMPLYRLGKPESVH
jgi:hypothetical protein